jgi:hypothetical protein
MLQLATLPARGAVEGPNLLITRAVEQHLLGSSALPKVGLDGLAVNICSSNLDERQRSLAYRRRLHDCQ